MKRLKQKLLFAIPGMLAVSAAVFLGIRFLGEPRFEGRSLSNWLDDPQLSASESRRGVRAIGTNAIPYLQEWLLEKPTWFELKMRDVNSLQQQFHFDYTPHVERQLSAMHGFFFLEELAQPAFPWLKEGLAKRDDLFLFYAEALVSSRGEGLELLLTLYPDLSPNEKFQVIYAVFFGLRQKQDLGDFYRPFMNDPDPWIRESAIRLLQDLDQCPPGLLQELVSLQDDPELATLAKSVHDHFTR